MDGSHHTALDLQAAPAPASGSRADARMDLAARPSHPQPGSAPPFGELDHPLPLIPSHELLQGHSAIRILHNGAIYRLQMTRQDKLILTK